MITIKEIASRLGLSTTTVSNVIHGKTKEVSAETIARVQKFLEEVEYVPNINARNLAQGQSKIIGVVLKTLDFRLWYSDNILSDPFVAEMIGGIERAVREAGYYMMLYISDDIAEIIQHQNITSRSSVSILTAVKRATTLSTWAWMMRREPAGQ